MKSTYLFPHQYAVVGWILTVPSFIVGLLLVFGVIPEDLLGRWPVFAVYANRVLGQDVYFGVVHSAILDEILCIVLTVGLILIAFSAEPHEDEFIRHLRLESLVWATKINYLILIMCVLFFYEGGFLYVLLFNMFTLLLLFIFRFRFVLMRSKTDRL
ncbi:MAG TPA: hypothetical protein PKE03_03665 [Bacteroidales bacterium]|nr:hypothetical protein [Bacteroidales bacterium]